MPQPLARELDEFTASVLGSITDGLLVLASDWRIEYANDRILERFRLTHQETIGKQLWSLFPDAVGQVAYVNLNRAMSERVPVEYELYYEPWQAWLVDRAYPVANGGLVLYSRDISERKRAEALQSGERQVLEMVATGKSLPEVLNAVCRLVESLDPSLLCSLLLPDVARQRIVTAVGPSLPEAYLRRLTAMNVGLPHFGSCGAVLVSGESVVVRDVRADGRFDVEWRELLEGLGVNACRSEPITGIDGSVLATFTIYRRERGEASGDESQLLLSARQLAGIAIERQQSEQRQRQAEERFRTTFDQAAVGVAHVGVDGRWLRVNRRLCEMLGYESHELTSRTFQEITYAADLDADVANAGQLLAGALTTYSMEKRYLRKDGTLMWGGLTASLARTPAGDPDFFIAVVEDISARKNAEEAVRNSEQRLAAILEQLPVGVGVMDETGTLSLANARMRRFVPRRIPSLDDERRSRWHAWYADGTPMPPEQWPARQALEGKTGLPSIEFLFTEDDGSETWTEAMTSSLLDAEGRPAGALLVIQDIDERKRAEERLRQLADAMPQIVYVTGGDGRVEFVNRQWQVYTGQYDADTPDLTGLVHPDDLPEMVRRWSDARASAAEFTAEFRLRCVVDDTYRWFLTRAVPERDATGGVIRWYGTSTDIDDLKAAEASLRYQSDLMQSITDNATTAIFMMDDRSRCTFMNPAAERMTGYSFAEIDGRILHEFIHHHYPDGRPYPMPECPIDRALPESSEVRNHEDLFFRKSGEAFPVVCNARVIYEQQVAVGTVIEVRDTTAERASATALQRLMSDLTEADRKKDEFLATLAHELRNPLAPIRNGLELMKVAADNADLVERARLMMKRQVAQMAQLIDDLMDLSRISRGSIMLQRTRLDLGEAVQDALDLSRPLIDERGHAMQVELPVHPVYVLGDRTRLAQAMGNLLTNAAKYTPPGGTVRLTVAERDGAVTITVRDNGIGIPTGMLDAVFEMFAQVDRSLGKTGSGLGIGLSIARQLAEMHGGSIQASSEGLDKGSSFVIQLPVFAGAAPDAGAAMLSSLEGTPFAGYRLLVVDDNRDSATSLADLLTMLGGETRTAYDGDEAVRTAEAYRPDVILMDIGMPNLNGYEACKRIRCLPGGDRIVLVAQTGWGHETDRRKSNEAGFDLHLVKPIDIRVLYEHLLRGRT